MNIPSAYGKAVQSCRAAQGHADFHRPVLSEAGPIISTLLNHSVFDANDNSLSVLARQNYSSPESVSNTSFGSNNSYLPDFSKRRFSPALTNCFLNNHTPSTPSFSIQNCAVLSCKQKLNTTTGAIWFLSQSQQTCFPLC